MIEHLGNGLNNLLVVMIFVGCSVNLISTYLVTPGFKIQSNLFLRKYKWKLALLQYAFCIVPFLNTGFALTIITAIYLLLFYNLTRYWFNKAIGEQDMEKLLMYTALKCDLRTTIISFIFAFLFITSIGLLLVIFHPNLDEGGFYIGLGFPLFSIALFGHLSAYHIKLRRIAFESKDVLIEKND